MGSAARTPKAQATATTDNVARKRRIIDRFLPNIHGGDITPACSIARSLDERDAVLDGCHPRGRRFLPRPAHIIDDPCAFRQLKRAESAVFFVTTSPPASVRQYPHGANTASNANHGWHG